MAARRISFFNGCSTGGGRRLPRRSVIPTTSTPSSPRVSLDACACTRARVAISQLVNSNPDGVIPPTKLPLMHAAVLEACRCARRVKRRHRESAAVHFDYANSRAKAPMGRTA